MISRPKNKGELWGEGVALAQAIRHDNVEDELAELQRITENINERDVVYIRGAARKWFRLHPKETDCD